MIEDDGKLKPVVGGFYSGKPSKKGHFEQQFNLAGEYMFKRSVLWLCWYDIFDILYCIITSFD